MKRAPLPPNERRVERPAHRDEGSLARRQDRLGNLARLIPVVGPDAGATPGDHTLVSRVTDVTGRVQRTAQDNETKKSFLEEDSQAPRKVKIQERF